MVTHDVQSPKNLMALAPKHKVFLSHAGAQKGFVEQLNIDLQQRDRHAFFDLDQECLPLGDKFPPLIIEAIQVCEVGVVILSKDFLRRKWPMLELVEMVRRKARRGDGLTIMPIFFDVSINDLKDEKNLSEWKIEWEKFAKMDTHNHINILEWEGALKELKPINGLIYNPRNGEVKLRKEIVNAICTKVSPYLSWDDSHVQGKSRFIEIIEKAKKSHMKNDMKKSLPFESNVLQVGLYGVGGIGKTTTCKFLCKHFEKEFCGKVCHVEVGKGTKMENLHTILKKLTNADPEYLSGLTDDQCYARLKNIGKVFLALDNLSSNPEVIEEVKKYLAAEYECGSIVVVTARSSKQFKGIVGVEHCFPMPEIEKLEAMNLISFHAEVNGEVEVKILEKCTKTCYFSKGDGSSHYVPLVLEAVGKHLRSSDPNTWVEQLRKNNKDIFDPMREEDHPIFTSLRISYDTLKSEDKDLFMDVAIFHSKHLMTTNEGDYYDIYDDFGLINQSHWNVYDWLRVLHGEQNIGEVKKRLAILKTKSLLEEVDDFKTIGMHDMWKEFAIYETEACEKRSRRWVCEHDRMTGGESILMDGGWKRLERICIQRDSLFDKDPMEPFTFTQCTNVLALRLNSVKLQERVADLSKLRKLKILEVFDSNLQKLSGLEQLQSLRVFIWLEINNKSLYIVTEIALLKSLQILQLGFVENFSRGSKYSEYSLLDIGNLKSLRVVRIIGGWFITKIRLSSSIRVLDISSCTGLTKILGLESLVALQILRAKGCYGLQAMPDMSNLTNLELLDLRDSNNLKNIPGMSKLIALQRLDVHGKSLRKLPATGELINLDTVCIHWSDKGLVKYDSGSSKLKARQALNLGCIHWSDKGLVKYESGSSKNKARQALNLGMFENVLTLNMNDIDYNELTNLYKLTRLEGLSIDSSKLKKLPYMGNHMRLKSLSVRGKFLRSWDGVGTSGVHLNWTLAHLMKLVLRLTTFELPDLSHFPQLTELYLSGASAEYDQQIGHGFAMHCRDDHVHLKKLEIIKCPIIQLPDLSKFTFMEELSLANCQLLPCLTSTKPITTLNKLCLYACWNLKLLPDVSYMPGLETLSIWHSNLERLPNMKSLAISSRKALRSWDGVGGSRLQDPHTNVELYCNWLKLYLSFFPIQLPDLSYFPQLRELSLYKGDPHQSNISGYALQCHTEHVHLKVLMIIEWPITELPDLSKFSFLEKLRIEKCKKLRSLTSSKPLATMKELLLEECKNLKELIPICHLPGLRSIYVSGCGVTLTEDDLKELPSGCRV